jgi:hypothetical protein
MYKQYYTDPRFYFIDGFSKSLRLSKMLTRFVVEDEDGNKTEREIPKFQITVRPNSNFPQRFEFELAFLLQLAQTPSPDGKPYVTREAIIDVIAERYPKLGRDGRYYQMAEALAMGLQQQAQQAAQAEKENITLRNIAGKYKNLGIKELMGTGVLTKVQPGQPAIPEPNLKQPAANGGYGNGQAESN